MGESTLSKSARKAKIPISRDASKWDGKREDDHEKLCNSFTRKIGLGIDGKPKGKLFRSKQDKEK